nr:MAG: hypothetical protein KatS3mg041_1431 [Bacteroidota bacterium]
MGGLYRCPALQGPGLWTPVGSCPSADVQHIRELAACAMSSPPKGSSDSWLRQAAVYGQALFEMPEVGIAVLDLEGRFRQANRYLAHLLGREPGELEGRSVLEITHPEDRADTEAVWDRLRQGELEGIRYEKRFLCRDGSALWGLAVCRLVRGLAEEPFCIKVFLDISPQKGFEERLRQSEALYRYLFEHNPQAMWIYDTQSYRFLAVNEAALHRYGYSREEFLQLTLFDIRPPEEWERLRHSLEHGSPGIEASGPWRHRRKDGRLLWVHITSHPIAWQGRPARLVVATDVTELKEIEEALRDSEERFRTLVEHTSAAVFLYQGAHLVYANPACARISGYPIEELLSRPFWEFVHPEDRDQVRVRGLARQRRQVEPSRYELRILRPDGQVRWLDFSAAPTRWRGRPAVIATAVDITDRKEAEAALLRWNQELEARVRERTAALEAALRELEAFSYSVSHDLRAPLRAIDGFSLALLEDYGDRLEEEGRHYLARIRAAVQRMGMLIDDLLRLSRVSRSEPQRVRVHLSAIASQIAELLQQADPDRRLRWEIDPDLWADADPGMMRVLLQNLLENAWKYTRSRPEAHIRFGVLKQGERSVYFVQDNGIGFPPDQAERIFQPFTRLEPEYEGTGVGLATAERIVRRHGGRIWAEGRPGEGAVFYFTLEP